MSPSFLLSLFDSVYLVALTAWVGSILFFSFGVAPIIFGVLGEQTGGKFVRALFPRYYLWGAIAGAIALPAFVARPLCYHEFRGPLVGVQAMVILAGILSMLYGGNSLTPAINEARDAGASGQKRFEQLHRRAVRLNGLVLVVGLGLLVAFATRRAPVSSGLNELTPAAQVRYDAAVNRLIEDIEARHGMRPPRVLAHGETDGRDPIIDDATVQEIESLYERKRLRDEARGRRDTPVDPSARPGAAVQSPASAVPSSSGTAQPPSSGGPRLN
jgi:Domain of unknown function (DUF4149)